MKKIIVLVLVIALTLTAFAGCGNDAEVKGKMYPQDPFTSVSKPNEKYQLGVTLEEMTTLQSKGFPGTYLAATTNPDGTPNVGYFIYSVTKVGEKYYFKQYTAHQTGANMFREKGGQLVWIDQYNSAGSIQGKNYTSRGAKMHFILNDDAAIREALKATADDHVYEITDILQIG